MNIVYGVSGEGLGHVFEAREIVPLLQRHGHTVKVLTYGDRASQLLNRFQPVRIEGVPLYFNRRGLSVLTTARKSLHCIPFYFKNWPRLKRNLIAFKADVFLTAYEPFTTFVSHFLSRPLVSMDNQNELLHLRRSPGSETFDFKLARLTTRICTHGAAYYVVKSFATGASSSTENVRFVAPLIQAEIRTLRPTEGRHLLVYLTKPNPDLIEILKSIPETFVVYCHGKRGDDGNISYRAPGPGYLRDLGSCKAIIGTTGFSLIADAIYLKKPYFGVPLKKQFEQIHNARFLRQSGVGEFSENVSRIEIERFLAGLGAFRHRLAHHYLDPAEQGETLCAVLAGIAKRASLARPSAQSQAFAGNFQQQRSVPVHSEKEEEEGTNLPDDHG
jgi:uncharacterized protein (TIGR00661 family)